MAERKLRELRPVLRLRAIAIAGLCIALAGTIHWKPPILLLWNSSPSVPVGLYRIKSATNPERGELVIGFAPPPFRMLAERRGYVPSTIPLVKRVAAIGGDRVCVRGHLLTINRRAAAAGRAADLRGRPLPSWRGCRTLGPSELLLLGDRPDSFDGRYFGLVRRSAVLGKAVRL